MSYHRHFRTSSLNLKRIVLCPLALLIWVDLNVNFCWVAPCRLRWEWACTASLLHSCFFNKGRLGVVKLLLKKGTLSKHRFTSLACGIGRGKRKRPRKKGFTSHHVACGYGHVLEVAELLLEKVCDVDATTKGWQYTACEKRVILEQSHCSWKVVLTSTPRL